MLFLGPSFAFGWGVNYEESYAGLTDRAMRRDGRTVEVIDAGVPAQPMGWALCWLHTAGRRLRPDVIVQTVYILPENLETSCPSRLHCPIVRDGFLFTDEPRARLRLFAAAKKSALVFYGFYFVRHLLERASPPGTGDELQPSLGASELPGVTRTAERYVEYRHFARDATGDSTDVLFVFVPLSYMVHPSDAGRWAHLGVERVSSRAVARERQRLAALAAELSVRGIAFVDPTAALTRVAEHARAYYWLDVHLTPLGNRAIAESLIPALQAILDRRARGVGGPGAPAF